MKIINIVGSPGQDTIRFSHLLIDKIEEIQPGRTGIINENEELRLIPGTEPIEPLYSANIDNKGSFIGIEDGDLQETLDLFSDMGIKYAILTGFYEAGFKKVILGDLEAEKCTLRNPSVEDIIESIDEFDDHYTMQGLVKELKEEIDIPKTGCYLHFNGIVREITGDEKTEYMDFSDSEYIERISAEMQNDMEKVPGVLGVRFYHSRGRLYAGDDVTYIAVAASHRQEAFKAMMDAIDRLKADLHNKK